MGFLKIKTSGLWMSSMPHGALSLSLWGSADTSVHAHNICIWTSHKNSTKFCHGLFNISVQIIVIITIISRLLEELFSFFQGSRFTHRPLLVVFFFNWSCKSICLYLWYSYSFSVAKIDMLLFNAKKNKGCFFLDRNVEINVHTWNKARKSGLWFSVDLVFGLSSFIKVQTAVESRVSTYINLQLYSNLVMYRSPDFCLLFSQEFTGSHRSLLWLWESQHQFTVHVLCEGCDNRWGRISSTWHTFHKDLEDTEHG